MGVISTVPRLVRLHDRLDTGQSRAVWKINPRTGYVESRAGLSWTGVGEYSTPGGMIRVLRRPSQVNSPGHKKTLRRLPAPDGHPPDDADMTPGNSQELIAGYTGDQIDVEEINGYARPVGNVTVYRPATLAKILSAEVWRQYQRDFAEHARDVLRTPGPPHTGTSLGYNALWYGPYDESEIVGEAEGGALIGSWKGPHGPELYDIEHVIDPACEIVQRLARDNGFDPEMLGANHFAIGLKPLGGRGAEQSELMRVVDSRELIGFDPASTRVQVAVKGLQSARDMKWVVSTDRELPLEDGDRAWDGDTAKASVFEQAGWPDNPKPGQASRAFLIHDADAPELIGSYKLPIARVGEDGKLRVAESGLRAAAQALPKTDAPQEVLDRAQGVLDSYFEQARAKPNRDARQQGNKTMALQVVNVAVGRDVAKNLRARDIAVPQDYKITLDELPAGELLAKLGEINEAISAIMEALAASEMKADQAEAEVGELQEKMQDMPSVEEAQGKVAELVEGLAAAEKALEDAKAAAEQSTKDAAAQAVAITRLEDELAPLRTQQFTDFKAKAIEFGFAADDVNACADALALKRHVVMAHVTDAATRYEGASALLIGAAFDGAWSGFEKVEVVAATTATAEAKKAADKALDTNETGPGLRAVPALKARDSNPPPQPELPAEPSTAALLKAQLSAI